MRFALLAKAGVELNVLNFSQFGLEKGLKDVIKLHSTHAKVFKLTLVEILEKVRIDDKKTIQFFYITVYVACILTLLIEMDLIRRQYFTHRQTARPPETGG